MDTLPFEVFEYIMSFLSVKDQFSLRRVCHSWKWKVELVLQERKKLWIVYCKQSRTDLRPKIKQPSRQCFDPRHHLSLKDLVLILNVQSDTDFRQSQAVFWLCPNLKVVAIDVLPFNNKNNHRQDVLRTHSETIECFRDNSRRMIWYTHCCLPVLQHISVRYMDPAFMWKHASHPALTSIEANTFCNSNDIDWTKLPSGLKQLRRTGTFDTGDTPRLGDVLISPAVQTLEMLSIKPDMVWKVNTTSTLPKVRHLDISVEADDEWLDEHAGLFPSLRSITFFKQACGFQGEIPTISQVLLMHPFLDVVEFRCGMEDDTKSLFQLLSVPISPTLKLFITNCWQYAWTGLPLLFNQDFNIRHLDISVTSNYNFPTCAGIIVDFIKNHLCAGKLESLTIRFDGICPDGVFFSIELLIELEQLGLSEVVLKDKDGRIVALDSPEGHQCSFLFFRMS